MAVPYNTLNTFCREKVVPKLVDNVYNSSPLIAKLLKEKKVKWNGGTSHDLPILIGKNGNAEAYGDSATLTIAKTEEATKARFTPTRYNVAVTIEGIEESMNKGDGKVLELVKEKIKNAEKSLIDLFGQHLFASQAGNNIIGLGDIIEQDAGSGSSFGGVLGGSNGDVAGWISSVDTSTTALTKLLLNKKFNAVKFNQDKCDLMVTTDDIWAGISTTFLEPNLRYTDTKMADLGFENFKYRGATVISDDNCPAGDLYLLNTNHVHFAVFPDMDFKFFDFASPTNQDLKTAHIRWYGQLVCDSRRSIGAFTALTSVA